MLGGEEEQDYDPPPTVAKLIYDDDQHRDKVLENLNALRKNIQFCDVTLRVGSHNVNAHRAVLASSSVYLFELFSTQDGGEDPAKQYYDLEGVDYESFSLLVNYAYTSKLEVPSDMVRSVYKTATKLKMQEAAEVCSRHLAENLSVPNCLDIRSFASGSTDEGLKHKTDEFIRENLDQIIHASSVRKLPKFQVDIMGLEENELKPGESWQICKLVVDWAQHTHQDLDTLELGSEHPHVLYLTSENTLQDCLDVDDGELNNSDRIQDYRKLGKKKQMGSKKPRSEKNASKASTNGHSGSRQPSVEKSPLANHEWKVIAAVMSGGRNCISLVVLKDLVTLMSVSFNPYPPRSDSFTNGTPSSGSVSPTGSPAGSPVFNGSLGKHCSLLPLAPMNSARCGFGIGYVGDNLVAIGGYDRGECLKTVESYNPSTNLWSELPAMLSGRGRFSSCQIDGKIYACGGSDGSRELKSMECYDPTLQKWKSLPSMMTSRSGIGVAALKNHLYVVGGWKDCECVTDCESYDPVTKKWSKIAGLQEARYQAGIAVLEDQIIAAGGCDHFNCLTSVEKYDLVEDEWEFLPHLNAARRGAGAAVFKGKLYVIGGSDGQSCLASVEIFDPETETWSFGPTMSVPRSNVGVGVVGDRLFALGGFSGTQFLDSIEYLSQDGHEWCSFVP